MTEEKIKLEINKIDSLRFNKISNYKKYRNMSSCGGSVSASILNDTANYIYSISGVELYTSILVVYLKDNQPIRIYYYESIPEWDKFNNNPNNDSISEISEIIDIITYKEKTVEYYLTESVKMYKYIDKEIEAIASTTNKELLEKLLNCVETIKQELKK